MSVRPLRYLGDPILRTPTEPVTVFDAGLGNLVDDLLDTVALPGRAGLAAPQIGVGLAAFSFDVGDRRGYVINPQVVHAEGDNPGYEACLSVPGVTAETPRSAHVVVRGVDRHGEPVEVAGTGELARCLQHETDHLAGMLYLDRLTRGARRRALDQYSGPPG
jgi:peptide deformylase